MGPHLGRPEERDFQQREALQCSGYDQEHNTKLDEVHLPVKGSLSEAAFSLLKIPTLLLGPALSTSPL